MLRVYCLVNLCAEYIAQHSPLCTLSGSGQILPVHPDTLPRLFLKWRNQCLMRTIEAQALAALDAMVAQQCAYNAHLVAAAAAAAAAVTPPPPAAAAPPSPASAVAGGAAAAAAAAVITTALAAVPAATAKNGFSAQARAVMAKFE